MTEFCNIKDNKFNDEGKRAISNKAIRLAVLRRLPGERDLSILDNWINWQKD